VSANLLVFAAAAARARVSGPVADEEPGAAVSDPRDPNRWILPLIAISGGVSFTYEVLWTRLLGHVLGGSVYAFATMLATFLTGIAIGSWLASGRMVADRRSAAGSFAWAQVGAGLLSLAAYIAIDSTPAWVQELAVKGDARLLLDAGIAAAILLPGTLCIGAIVGAIGAGFFLIPALGFGAVLVIAVATNAVLALATAWRTRPRPRASLAAAAAVIALLVVLQPGPPWQLLRMGVLASRVKQSEITYYGVGRSSTVMLQQAPDGWQLSSNALAEAVINRRGVRGGRFVIVRWMSNLPSWGRPDSKKMLVVGFGGGLVVEAVPESFEQVDVVEIEPEVLKANAAIAELRQRDPLADPRLELIINDARGALLLTDERYDAVVSQPSHPWTAAASHLYTREFFELVREHLSEQGVFVQWMGLKFIDESLMKTLVATLLDVFPHVRVYQPSPGGLLFTASMSPFEPERILETALESAPGDASELGVWSGADVVAHMLLDDEGSRAFAAGAPVSTDDRNLLQMNSPRIVRNDSRFDVTQSVAADDPLAQAEIEWSRPYLVRRMLATRLRSRAERVASAATDPVERHVVNGLLAHRNGDLERAISELRRATRQGPDDEEARFALLRALRSADRNALLERFGLEPTAIESLIVRGWTLDDERDVDLLRALETDLAAVPAIHPAFVEAASLRVSWRMQEGSAERAQEALTILDEMLPMGAPLKEFLTRALAASRAGHPAGATASISEFIRRVSGGESNEPVLRQALALVRQLPPKTLSKQRREAFARQIRGKLRN
jgi:hypothetical protein